MAVAGGDGHPCSCARWPSVKYTQGVRTRFFGQFLLSQGLITAPQLLAAVEYQQRHNPRLGELAAELGMLTAFDASRVNALQAERDLLFGEAAVQLGVLDRAAVQQVLAAQQDQHVLVGEALVHLGYLKQIAVDEAVLKFEAAQQGQAPNAVQVDEGTPEAHVARELFGLAHRLLLRSWGLNNKPDQLRIEQGPLWLSDCNAVAPLTDVGLGLVLGVPLGAAEAAAKPFSGDATPGEAQQQEMVTQLAHVLAANLASVMAEQGRRLRPGEASAVGSRLDRDAEARTLLVPFVTQHGQVLVGLTV